MTSPTRRVALVCPSDDYVGPELVIQLARAHDIVCGPALPDAARDAARAHGARLVVVDGAAPHDLETGRRLVEAALGEFGTFNSAFFSSGRIAVGRFANTDADDLRAAFEGNMVAPYAFVRAVLPTLIDQHDGQVLVATSATATHPTPSASLYAGTRAGATMLLRSAAMEFAADNVQLNVVGTNFMDFPAFLKGNKAESLEGRARVESKVPMRRLGTMAEFARFCMAFLDGTSRFQTGQFFAYSGGWSH